MPPSSADVHDVEVQREEAAQTTARQRRRPSSRVHPLVGGLVVLLLGLAATFGATRWRTESDRSQRARQLDTLTSDTGSRVTSGLMRYGDLLTSLAAFHRQGDRSLDAYEAYTRSIGVQAYTGVTMTGFLRYVSGAEEIADLVADRRANGQPDFTVALTGEGPGHAVVEYAVPDAADVTGIDLAGDPVRWAALMEAARLGYPVISPSLVVLEEWKLPASEANPSIQVYLPVYEDGVPITFLEQRQAALVGWVGVSLDVPDVLGSLSLGKGLLDVVFRDEATGALMAESRPGAVATVEQADLTSTAVVDTGSRRFVIDTAFTPGAVESTGPAAVALSGSLAALAAAYAAFASLRFRRSLYERAEGERRRADVMTSRFHAAVDAAPVGVTVVRLDGGVELVNDRLRELMRVEEDGNLSIIDYFRPEDRDELMENIGVLSSGEVDHLVRERQLVRRDGTLVWCRISSSVLRDDDGNVTGIVGHVEDIEAERAAIEQLRSRSRWFASIVERSSDMITLFDADGIVTWVSPSVVELLGREAEEIVGQSVLPLVHRADRDRVVAAIRAVIAGKPARAEYRVPNGRGEWVWLESTASNLLDDPDVRAIIALSRDVTERHRATEALAHRASHDPLTGLANRAELEHRLSAAIERTKLSGGSLSLLYLDLDGFKPVNDSFGHAVGDQLLRIIGSRLKDQVRDDDLIARVGGDEFVVVLPGADLESALGTAERIRLRIADPVVIDGAGEPVLVTASFGLAIAAGDSTVTSLLREADAALYEAKRRGRDRVEVSTVGSLKLGGKVEELLEDALRELD